MSINIEKTEVLGWEHAIRGMRNPMNSWVKSDTCYHCEFESDSDKRPILSSGRRGADIGPNDLDLMKRLRKGGSDDRKYLRMISVYADITAPLYWWKEFDTYKVGTVANSCSTMHKIHAKEFTLDDFSHEHLTQGALDMLDITIEHLNFCRRWFLAENKKVWWWQMIQLLPTSYNQKRTVMLNYEVLANMYHSRKNHKLDEWRELCEWIKTLPYSELITGEESNED